MIVTFVVGFVATITNTELPRGEMSLALRSMERLAAMPTDKIGATIEKHLIGPRKAELESLLIYLAKVHEVMMIGNLDTSKVAFYQNLMTVVAQTSVAGKQLAVTPEEALCWDRLTLNYAAAFRYYAELQVQAGKLPPQAIHQVIAGHNRCLQEYRKSLAGLVENVR